MLDRLLAIIAPHYCSGCGEIGDVLCDCCKNNIQDEVLSVCIYCRKFVKSANLCAEHNLPYSMGYVVGFREKSLLRLIDDFKFHRNIQASRAVAELIHNRLPDINQVIIIPTPTTPRNIRVRGYDQMVLVAKDLSKLRNWPVKQVLIRQNNTTQHFIKSASKRKKQAKNFFKIDVKLDPAKTYLLIDDILTTGSTIQAAAECLRSAGAVTIVVAVIALQK